MLSDHQFSVNPAHHSTELGCYPQYAIALEILQQKRNVLDEGAGLLLEKEKIEGTELKALMDG